MTWTVLYHDAFLPEMEALTEEVQDSLLVTAELLIALGPSLGRPHADTLAGSKYANMKELRFRADDGVWRVAFAFDPERRPSSWWRATRAGWCRNGSTRGSSPRPMPGSPSISIR